MKKTDISASRTTLCTQKTKFCMQNFFFGKCLLAYKIDLRLKKKTKNFGATSKLLQKNAIKKLLVRQFPCMEIVW